jgi:hypothetical protein
MLRFIWSFAVLTAVSVAGHAEASGLIRTFVSSTGSDSNPCTTAAPCATFAAAYAAVAPNGIVSALDPGKYGPVTISGPVTIDGHGWAAITAPAATGNEVTAAITVEAQPNDAVILSGLLMDGQASPRQPQDLGPPENVGIQFYSGLSLTVIDCDIRNMTGNGIVFLPASDTPTTLTVSRSRFVDNLVTGLGVDGAGAGAVTVSVDRSIFDHNGWGFGIDADGSGAVSATVTNSVASNNTNDGFSVQNNGSNATVTLTLTQSQASGNGTGLDALSANATIYVGQSTISDNGAAFQMQDGAQDGAIISYGDNYFDNNGAGSGILGSAVKQ